VKTGTPAVVRQVSSAALLSRGLALVENRRPKEATSGAKRPMMNNGVAREVVNQFETQKAAE
jgi:hypothetical protein